MLLWWKHSSPSLSPILWSSRLVLVFVVYDHPTRSEQNERIVFSLIILIVHSSNPGLMWLEEQPDNGRVRGGLQRRPWGASERGTGEMTKGLLYGLLMSEI